MKVTISDVARLAGVSTATVSHTINSTRYVSGETKEKVYRAIAELGYTPDASARSFRTGKKKTIGFIVPDISNKFFATMIESVENYLSAHGYHLIIANTKENPEREETNIRLLSAGLVDGLLIASAMEDFSRFESLIPAGFPVVLVDRTFDTKRFPSVSVSNFQPIYRSVCRLAGKGDKRIGMIGGLPRLSSTKERIAAYQEAVADCGLPQDDLLIRYGGDEFLLLFPKMDKHIFTRKQNEIREAVRRIVIPEHPELHLSVSFGGVSGVHPLGEAVRQADCLMYENKEQHRARAGAGALRS